MKPLKGFGYLKGILLLAPLFLLPVSLTAQVYNPAYVVTHYAGDPNNPGSSDGGRISAHFWNPGGVAVDASGNMFVADTGSCTIRKVTPAGVVTTFAGTAGVVGSANGAGTAAQFNSPQGIAIDSKGVLYVADQFNNIIRKITPAGAVSTLAGKAGLFGSADGTGANARFNGPWGIALDAAGNVYVADSNNASIRKITPAGVVSTLVTPQFEFPTGICLDSAGNIFVSEFDGETIRKITPAGVTTIFAGRFNISGSVNSTIGTNATFDQPQSLAIDSSNNIYVADANNHKIRKITSGAVVTTLAGSGGLGATDATGTQASFGNPTGLGTDAAGNVFVTDNFTQLLRKVTSGGVVTTLAGDIDVQGTNDGPGLLATFFSPGDVVVDAGGNLYVADSDNNTIRKISAAGAVTTLAGLAGVEGTADGTGSAARFKGPEGVAVDKTGNVYVADTSSSTIRKITPAGLVTTFAGSPGQDGLVDGTGTAARFSFPENISIDKSGNLYVADTANSLVRKITSKGVVTTVPTPGVVLSSIYDVAVDSTGNIFVADAGNNRIVKISSTGVASVFAGNGNFGSTDGTGTGATLGFPSGLAIDASNNVIFSDGGNNTIRRITPAGVVTTVAGNPLNFGDSEGTGPNATFDFPKGITIDSSGAFYVTNFLRDHIFKGVQSFPATVTFKNADPDSGDIDTTYDGKTKSVTVTTNPPGLKVVITYSNGDSSHPPSPVPPSGGGTYDVIATIVDKKYQGSAETNLHINQADQTISTFTAPSSLLVGQQIDLTGPTASSGLPVTFSFDEFSSGDTELFINGVEVATLTGPNQNILTILGPGPIQVYAHQTGNPNYNPAPAPIQTIGSTIGVSVSLTGELNPIFDGTPKHLTAVTSRPDLNLNVPITYAGSATAPAAAGTYAVKAAISDPSATYSGSTSGTMTIKLNANVAFSGALSVVYNGKARTLTTTTSARVSKVVVTYNGSLTAPTNVGTYTVVATVVDSKYGGSTASMFTITPIGPAATTSAATFISATMATVNSTITPNGSVTSAHFEYGTTVDPNTHLPIYDHQSANQSVGSSTTPFAVNLTTLAPTTLYHFRVVATNAGGTIAGKDLTFTTLAAPDFVGNPTPYLGASGAEVVHLVNPNGIATMVAFQYGTTTAYGSTTAAVSIGSGKVAVNAFVLFSGLLPNTTYHYRLISTGPAGIFFGSDHTFTTLGFETSLVAQTGDAAVGTTSTFATFGSPIVNVDDAVAFNATLKLITGVTSANNIGIWADDNTDTRHLVAQIGGAAPGTGGANFATLGDPVSNDNAAVAFRATLKTQTGVVTTSNATGVWSSSSGTLQLVARQGSTAPGTGGATFATFTSLGLTNSAGAVFAATLNAGTGISAANNSGIWEGNSAGDLHIVLRLGDTVGPKTITKLTFLPTETYVNGQTRGFNASGGIICGATFSDKTTGLVKVVGGTPSITQISGSNASGTAGATYATFGNSAINNNGRAAFQGTMTSGVGGITSTTNTGIWADNSAGTRLLIAQIGTPSAPSTAANFLTFSNPVYNSNEAVAFRATLKGTGVSTSNSVGIWATNGNATGLSLIAQQGVTPAPGCPAGATFATFTELALPDQGGATNKGGVIFLATLNTNTLAAVTSSNNLGIWAIDNAGALQLVIRTGDTLNLNPSGVPNFKTITGLAFLPVATIINGQSRSFDQFNGDLVYVATFSDKSTAIFNVSFP